MRITVAPVMDSMAEVMSFVEEQLSLADVPMKASMQIQIAVDEVFSNIVFYSGASFAHVDIDAANGEVTLRFTDDGAMYDPLAQPDPDVTLSAEERDVGGLGIFMVKKSMDSTEYKYLDGNNTLVLKKKYA